MKVYKITLYVSLIVFFILTVLSIMLNFWNNNEWISFIVNWCVGISCSIVVVVITTLIQFKVEQKKAIKELASNVRKLLFHNQIMGCVFEEDIDTSDISPKQVQSFEQSWFSGIEKDIETIYNVCSELEFFFDKNKVLSIRKHCLVIRINYVKDIGKKDVYFSCQHDIYEIAQAVLNLKIVGYDREEIEKYLFAYQEKVEAPKIS